MTPNIIYKVYPADLSNYKHIKGEGTSAMGFIGFIYAIAFFAGLILLFSGDSEWIICLVIFIALLIVMLQMQKRNNEEARNKRAIEEAEFYSNKLNLILDKSNEIIKDILPYYITGAENHISAAKTDLSDKAISPFWDKIEEATKCLALYNEAVYQLNLNGEIYSKILSGKKHNFPNPYPFGTNIRFPQSTIDEFNIIIRKAHMTDGFSNIWEHKKTQKILIVGFQNIVQAINNMSDAISASINELKYSVESNFREVKHFQQEQLKTFESSQLIMNNTLHEMDTKLYYMQYNKKPYTPFVRPLFER